MSKRSQAQSTKPWMRSVLSAASLLAVGVATLPGCPDNTGVGDPCTPEQEYDVRFTGFDIKQVIAESKSLQCKTRVCLVHHFRGRVSCPYGQSTAGGGCFIPGTQDNISGDPDLPEASRAVVATQCLDRRASNAVYCSCRCANANGETNDGANYCTCPDGFTCGQVYPPTGLGNEGLTGGYCVKAGTEYNTAAANCINECSASAKNCEGG